MESFPDLFFEKKEFETIFNLTYEDLFILDESNNKYIFLILNSRLNKNWILGSVFLRKYQFTFNTDSKTIGYYKSMNENIDENENINDDTSDKNDEEEENKEKENEENNNNNKENEKGQNNKEKDKENNNDKNKDNNKYITYIVIGLLFLIFCFLFLLIGMLVQKRCNNRRKKRFNELEDQNDDDYYYSEDKNNNLNTNKKDNKKSVENQNEYDKNDYKIN